MRRFLFGRSAAAAQRRGSVAVYVAASAVVMLGFAALAIDVGRLYSSRTELQAAADAAALAGAMRMLDQERLRGGSWIEAVHHAARNEAVRVAQLNPVLGESLSVSGPEDVFLGYLANPANPNEVMSTGTPGEFNSVRVVMRRNSLRNGPMDYLFASIFGRNSKDLGAEATATFRDGIRGFRVTDATGNAGLLPLALHVNAWNGLLNGSWTTGDNYSYNSETGAVTSGPDGILELNLYPGAGPTQLPPGNFGTVDIGNPNNSTADLSRQIRFGVNAADLAWFGGELVLGADGTLILNGDTGLSAAIKDDLQSIRGQPRTIPLFNAVAGPGNNANFTVVGWAGVRIMYVRLTGAMNSKQVIVQPAYVVDDSAISGSDNTSYYVYQPVRLTR